MKAKEINICSRCVMDTTDSKITFNSDGVCDHCLNFDKKIKPYYRPSEERIEELLEIAKKIKKHNRHGKYDCIIGLSGGVDSSYVVYIAKVIMGLNPLIYVVDTGWNLNVAVDNIEKVVRGLDLDMYTEVVNWKEMRDLQLSFFKSQISSQDLCQDHAIFAGLYNYAVKHKIKYVITGSNISTEFVRPPLEWIFMNDVRMIKDIHKKFGTIKLKTFPMCGILKYRLWYRYFKGMKRIYPLNYVNYDKDEAARLLNEKYGWTKYENKHYENVFTRWYEGYYMPHKFGFDTRKNVYSTQILAGTMTRDEALKKLKEKPYDEYQMQLDKEYIAQKLEVPLEEFDKIIDGENKTPLDYKNSLWFLKIGVFFAKLLGIENRDFR